MFRFLIIGTFLVACHAQYQDYQGHGFSTQSFVKHEQPAPVAHKKVVVVPIHQEHHHQQRQQQQQHTSAHVGHTAVSSQSFVSHHVPIQHHHYQPAHEAPVHYVVPVKQAPVHYAQVPVHQAPVQQQVHAAVPAAPKGQAISSQSFVSQNVPVQGHSQQGSHGGSSHSHEEEYYHHPVYKFEYSVHDDHTKDIKKHSEARDGDKVQGQYSLLQPDGHVRNVIYNSDKHSGFNAQVTYSHPGHSHLGYQ